MSKKSIWTIITGGLASVTPILFSVCKGGACVGVCVSPIASLFGASSAAIASSPLVSVLEPLLIAISAVSFTTSYYSLYVLPKFNCNTPNGCACEPTENEKRKIKITKAFFWFGLILSIVFLSYFEITKYQLAKQAETATTECTTSECSPGTCSTEEETTALCDSSSSCCNSDSKHVNEIIMKSEITCPKCGHKSIENMPTDVCQIKYVCKSCSAILYPKDGDCCVFCTYGDHKCPSKQ